MLRIFSKKGQPKFPLFGYHAYIAVALVTADLPTVLTDETFCIVFSNYKCFTSYLCFSLFVSSNNVTAIR